MKSIRTIIICISGKKTGPPVPRPRISLYCYLLSVGAATRPVDDDTVIVPFRIHAGAVVWRCRPDFTGARQRGGADRQSDPPAARRILSVRQTAESARPRTSCRRRGIAFSPRPGTRLPVVPNTALSTVFYTPTGIFFSSNGRSKVHHKTFGQSAPPLPFWGGPWRPKRRGRRAARRRTARGAVVTTRQSRVFCRQHGWMVRADEAHTPRRRRRRRRVKNRFSSGGDGRAGGRQRWRRPFGCGP